MSGADAEQRPSLLLHVAAFTRDGAHAVVAQHVLRPLAGQHDTDPAQPGYGIVDDPLEILREAIWWDNLQQVQGQYGNQAAAEFANFVGVPLMFVGGVMTSYGFMGALLRYQAAEVGPVGKDTINYVASGVKPAIKDVTQAVVEGIHSGMKGQFCTKCGTGNDLDAKFCKSCGNQMAVE